MESDVATEAVLAANEAFYHAFNTKDYDAMDHVWATSPDITCIHPGWNLLRGREPVLESWANIINNPAQTRIVVGGASVTFAGNTAIVLCRELVGGSPLAATNVFLREAGAWRLLHHQSGPVAQGA